MSGEIKLPDLTKAQLAAYVVTGAGWVEMNFGYSLPEKWKAIITGAMVTGLAAAHLYADAKIRFGRATGIGAALAVKGSSEALPVGVVDVPPDQGDAASAPGGPTITG